MEALEVAIREFVYLLLQLACEASEWRARASGCQFWGAQLVARNAGKCLQLASGCAPSGMRAAEQRATSSYSVLWKGTRKLSSGMSRLYTKRRTSGPDALGPRPSGGGTRSSSDSSCRGSMEPVEGKEGKGGGEERRTANQHPIDRRLENGAPQLAAAPSPSAGSPSPRDCNNSSAMDSLQRTRTVVVLGPEVHKLLQRLARQLPLLLLVLLLEVLDDDRREEVQHHDGHQQYEAEEEGDGALVAARITTAGGRLHPQALHHVDPVVARGHPAAAMAKTDGRRVVRLGHGRARRARAGRREGGVLRSRHVVVPPVRTALIYARAHRNSVSSASAKLLKLAW